MSKIFKIFMLPVYILSKFVPKDSGLIVIGSSKGYEFSDNSKYLYLYLLNKQNNKKIIWISRNKQIVTMIKNNGHNAEYYMSLKGLYFTIRAKVIVISHHLEDVNRYLTGGAKVIQLWHGNPIRKIGYDGDWNDRGIAGQIKKIIYTKLPFLYYMMCDILIVTSKKMADFYKKPFKYSFRYGYNVKVLGYPRLDAMNPNYAFNNYYFPEINRLNEFKKNYNSIVSWLPTHRSILKKTIVDIIIESKMNPNDIDKKLHKINALLIIKPHFLELNTIKKYFSGCKNIYIYNESDPYPLLNHTDILITDYSSVFIDFLIKNKPILFLPIDYEEYSNKVSFYYDYNSFVPGQICDSWDDIINNIVTLLNDKKDDFKENRDSLKKYFFQHKYDNCERVSEYILGLSL